jgi:alkylation response protein AidB-like acyl-CoA dehydrogenase
LDKLGLRASDTAELAFDDENPGKFDGWSGQGFLYMQHFALERLIMAINAHASRVRNWLYYRIRRNERLLEKISKFQALRHTMVEHATEVEHCKVFNYGRKIDKIRIRSYEATMAKLKSTSFWWYYIQLFTNAGRLWLHGRISFSAFVKRQFRPIGVEHQKLKEILGKMIIDQQNYEPVK